MAGGDVKEAWSGANQKENVLSGATKRREGSGANIKGNVFNSMDNGEENYYENYADNENCFTKLFA